MNSTPPSVQVSSRSTSNRFEFQHPLLRSAVYHGAPAAMRRAAHEAVAQELGSDRRAWHLAAAAPEPDATVAAELKAAGLAARARGGHAEAAAALEQAARLTSDSEDRARLLRSAADETRRSGQATRSLTLLDEALATTASPRLRARIQHLRGVVEMWRGAPLAAYEHLIQDAARIEQDDPAKAAWMLSDAGWAGFMGGDISGGRAASERAFALTEGTGGLAEIIATALFGIALLMSGERERAEPLLRRYEPLLDDSEFLGRSYAVVWPAAQALVWLEQHGKARDVFTRVIDQARARALRACCRTSSPGSRSSTSGPARGRRLTRMRPKRCGSRTRRSSRRRSHSRSPALRGSRPRRAVRTSAKRT